MHDETGTPLTAKSKCRAFKTRCLSSFLKADTGRKSVITDNDRYLRAKTLRCLREGNDQVTGPDPGLLMLVSSIERLSTTGEAKSRPLPLERFT